jgi:hypothetical protein
MPADRSQRRSPLGMGPLETAIMRATWETGSWLTVRDIRSRMPYTYVGGLDAWLYLPQRADVCGVNRAPVGYIGCLTLRPRLSKHHLILVIRHFVG